MTNKSARGMLTYNNFVETLCMYYEYKLEDRDVIFMSTQICKSGYVYLSNLRKLLFIDGKPKENKPEENTVDNFRRKTIQVDSNFKLNNEK